MHTAVIIVAGGTGERSGQHIPKQFVSIHNKPIIIHSIKKFFQYNPNILTIVVCNKNYLNDCQYLLNQYFPDKKIHITTGGETRFHSVKNGLEYLHQLHFEGIVAIHDAARPCVSKDLIQQCFEVAKKNINAIPAISMNESIRKVEGNSNTMAYRENFKIIQTPQCAEFSILYKAFQQNYQPVFTDEANVLETYGIKINLVEGEKNNIKITYPIDFIIAEHLLQ